MDLNDTLVLGQELLNSVYKTLGTIPGRSSTDPLETTPWSTLKVNTRTVSWRTGQGRRRRRLAAAKAACLFFWE